ncbi:MAG: hypothetical protein ACE5FV_03650 [Woeseia sp.]
MSEPLFIDEHPAIRTATEVKKILRIVGPPDGQDIFRCRQFASGVMAAIIERKPL